MDFDYLPEPKVKPYNRLFNPEIDKAILKYWPIKNKEQFAKALGISERIVRRRYAELTKNETTI